MNIIGADLLVFAVDDMCACTQFLSDAGLICVENTDQRKRFEALDGTGIVITTKDDPSLPPALETGATIRETIYGVADAGTLEAIAAELGRDRSVHRGPSGSVHSVDDSGFAIGFQVTVRRQLSLPAEFINAPGSPSRPFNVVTADHDKEITPRSLAHFAYYVPNVEQAENFYIKRLGFLVSDRFTNVGPFLRPAGGTDHHTLFLVGTPPHMKGMNHIAFHLGGPSEVVLTGTRLHAKGYQPYWGPGMHLFGSNWFWYFNSPLGCQFEVDADMDQFDSSWQPRSVNMSPDYASLFLFELKEKWAPGGRP